MDKETLTNYGWIVICILVLSVMIALATPFGEYIGNAVKSTTEGLFDVQQKALGVAGLVVEDQNFEDIGTEPGNNPSTTFSGYFINPGCHQYSFQHSNSCYTIETNTLNWEELKLAENGTKYGYNASAISDTTIGENAFFECNFLTSITLPSSLTTLGDQAFGWCMSLTSIDLSNTKITTIDDLAFLNCESLTNITIPNNVTSIGEDAFQGCSHLTSIDLPDGLTNIGNRAFWNCVSLTSINFEGTKAQWNAISFGDGWNAYCTEITVTCTDGTITIP